MEFLDKKEQVLDLQLTQYGKFLLSQGKLEPVYYSFHDDDVLYDSRAGGFVEVQNSASVRIKDETPTLGTIHLQYGAETEFNKDFNIIQTTIDRNNSYKLPIGTMALDAENIPAWSLTMLKGEISSSVPYTQSANFSYQKVPQLNLFPLEYKTFIKIGTPPDEDSFKEEGLDTGTDLSLIQREFKDGSYVQVLEDTIIIQVDEMNGFFEKENFDIEVFEITKDRNNIETLVPLGFQPNRNKIKNSILLEESLELQTNEITSKMVEYFFELLTDREIDEETLCILNPTPRTDVLDLNPFPECKELAKNKRKIENLYKKVVIPEDECK